MLDQHAAWAVQSLNRQLLYRFAHALTLAIASHRGRSVVEHGSLVHLLRTVDLICQLTLIPVVVCPPPSNPQDDILGFLVRGKAKVGKHMKGD